LKTQRDALAAGADLLERLLSQQFRGPQIMPIRDLVHPSNSDTEPRILGRQRPVIAPTESNVDAPGTEEIAHDRE
jgi:hypothetical protein